MDKSYKRKNNYKPSRGGSFNNWNSKKKFRNYLETGMKGFLCTCNAREKDCIREAYNILNEYAGNLFPLDEAHQPVVDKEETEASGDHADEGDIEDNLKKEVSSLQSNKRRDFDRFNVVDTGVKSNIFIKTTIEDPIKLAYSILSDVAATKVQKSRFLMRFVPVEVTCKAKLEEIKTAADLLFDKHFRCEPTTFAVVVNKRYNDSVIRDEIIHALALLVTDKNRDHKANLTDAKQTVLVEIMKGICCLSVLEDYKKLRHYNIAELAKPEETAEVKLVEGTETDVKGNEEEEEGEEGDVDSQEDMEESSEKGISADIPS